MKNKTITRIMALSLGAALLFSGCTSKEKEPEATPTPAVESETPKDYSKYNTYLNLVEDIYELEEILGVYFDNVEYAAEFAVREGGDYANIKEATDFYTPMTYTVEQALDYAKEEPAYPDADAAMLTLGDSPAKVMKAVGDISNYMQFNDFEDDDLAKAPELHAALMAALETYDLYYGSFLTAMETLADETRDEDIQELLDAGFELMVSEWNGRSIVQRELDPEETLVTGTKNTEISFWISDSSFARLSIDARNGEVRTGDAPVTRLELHLSFDAALPSDILISDVPVAELTRAKAGEMFPDFEQGDLSVTQKGADYQCTLMFSPQTLNLYQFSLRDTWGDAPAPEIKVPSI